MMTLPNYKDAFEYWTEMDKRYSCGLHYGFHYYNNQIIPAFIKKLAIYKYELYKSINVSNQSIYLFPNIPNKSDYNKFLKDFLYKLKLDRINDDFS